MKLKTQKSQIVHITGGEFEGGSIGIDAENMGMAMKMFSQYSDVISSIVREVTSNGLDAHTEALMISSANDKQLEKWHYTGDFDAIRNYFSTWKNRNVRVTIREGNPISGAVDQLEVQDFGVGMSPKRMDKIFRKFFSSTKRDTNQLIGAFGLGSKSPLGYCDLFSVTTIYFGTRYEYVIHAGTTAPELKLISECETGDENGTTFIIPIKDRRDGDQFRAAVCKQLMYFDGLVIEGVPEYSKKPIIMGKHFIFREDSHDELHLCLGKVYYRLDMTHFSDLTDRHGRIRKTAIPIGLRFEIGELDIVWNRESIEYTSETIDAIKMKIDDVKVELQELWDLEYSGLDTIRMLADAADQASHDTLIIDGISIPNIGDWIEQDVFYSPNPNMGRFKNSHFLKVSVKVDRVVKLGKTKQVSSYQETNLLEDKAYLWDPDSQNSDPFLNEYIYSEKNLAEFYLISREDEEKAARLMVATCIRFDKSSSNPNKSQYTTFEAGTPSQQQEWIHFMKEVMQYIESIVPIYERKIVPDKWLEAKKASKKAKSKADRLTRTGGKTVEVKDNKLPTTSIMPYRHLRDWSNYGQYTTAWKLCTVHFSQMNSALGEWLDNSRPIIYGTQDNREELINLYNFVKGVNKFDYILESQRGYRGNPLFVIIAKGNLKVLNLFQTAFTVREYQSRLGGLLIKAKTANLIQKPVKNLVGAHSTAMGQVDGYCELYDKLHRYCNKYEHHATGIFYNQCVEETPLDQDILHVLWKATAIERRFPMLAHVHHTNGQFSDAVSAEFDKYFRDKGQVSPELYKRLAEVNKIKKAKKYKIIANIVGSLNPQ